MGKLSITEADKGKTLEVRRDDLIVVRLPENPTTGYRWALDEDQHEILFLEKSEFSLPKSPKVGGGGTRIFTFRAKRAGTAQIRLKNWRDWEGEASVIDRFDSETVVRD